MIKLFDFNKKSHRFIVLLIIAIPVLSIGFGFLFLAQHEAKETSEKEKTEKVQAKESEQTDSSPVSEEQEEEESEEEVTAPASEMVSEEEKEKAKLTAEKFAQIYGNYDSEKPLDFVYNAKPYMTEEFYSRSEENPPRQLLGLAKSTVKSFDTYPVDIDELNVLVFNVVLKLDTVNQINKKVYQETTILISLEKENGEWKVKSMDAQKVKGSDVQHG